MYILYMRASKTCTRASACRHRRGGLLMLLLARWQMTAVVRARSQLLLPNQNSRAHHKREWLGSV